MKIAKGVTGYFFISKNNDGFNRYPSDDLLLLCLKKIINVDFLKI